MARYTVKVTDAVLDDLYAHLPEGWWVTAVRRGGPLWSYVDVRDEYAPAWTAGRLIDPELRKDYRTGTVTVGAYRVDDASSAGGGRS